MCVNMNKVIAIEREATEDVVNEVIVWDFDIQDLSRPQETIRVLVDINNERVWMTARKRFFSVKDFVFELDGEEVEQQGEVLRYFINEENDVFV